ncbi:MAG: hypothetical protein WC030_00845 [Candidatus Paceibacterota bacterium]
MNRIFQILREKDGTLGHTTEVLASPIFAAIFDPRADLSNVQGVMQVLGLPFHVKKDSPVRCDGKLQMPAEQRFVVSERFVEDDGAELPVELDEAFKKYFGDVIEEAVEARPLWQWAFRYQRKANFATVASTLGGKKRARVSFAHVFHFLKAKGCDSMRWYLFFVSDSRGTVRTLMTYWNGRRWVFAVDRNEPFQPGCHYVVDIVTY